MALESIGQALKYIAECFRMALEEPGLLAPSFLSVVLGALFGVAVLAAASLMSIFSDGAFSPFFIAMFLVALAVNYTAGYLLMAVSSFAIYEHLKFGHSDLRKAFGRALSRWSVLLGLAVAAVLVSVFAGSLKNGAGRRGGVIAGLLSPILSVALEEGWKIASALLVPVAVIGSLGFVDTFKKAFDIVRNNLVLIGSGEVGIRILTGLFGFFGFVLSVLVAIGLYLLLAGISGLLAIAVAVIFAFMAISLVTTINQFVRVSFYTMAYAWAEEHIEHGAAGAAAAPLKKPFGI